MTLRFDALRPVGLVVAVGGAAALAAPAAHGQSGPGGSAAGVVLRFEVDSSRSTARYRVREQLAGFDLPNDAVGETSSLEGTLALDAAGAVVPGASRFVMDVASLTSDADRRDGYLRARVFQTEEHPEIVLVPTELRGAPHPLPEGGSATFQLVGDLRVKGVTLATVWDVTATFGEGAVTATATTAFTFEDIGLEKPRVGRVLSVDDQIRLELEVRMVEVEPASSLEPGGAR